jgi:hypothetical protein
VAANAEATGLEQKILEVGRARFQDFLFGRHVLGDVAVEVRTNDRELLDEIATTFGPPSDAPAATRLGATIVTDADGAIIRFEVDDPKTLAPDDMLVALESPTFPFRLIEPESSGWTAFAFRDDEAALFHFRDEFVIVRRRENWRAGIGFLLLHRIYRMRSDAIFFHAATVDVFGRGVMLVGAKGAGKSTTALALAARGRTLLGDEIACYVPRTRELVPFLRPVGIKPGIRSLKVHGALVHAGLEPGENIVRVDIRRFMEVAEPHAVPLAAIVFLEPFEATPRLEPAQASMADVGRLQPSSGSLVNVPAALRTMQMAQMLSWAKIFRLSPADPDETAALLESAIGDLTR